MASAEEVGGLRGAAVAQLVSMGFEEPAAAEAMRGARGDINRALSSLVGEEHPPSPPPLPARPSFSFSFSPDAAGVESRDTNPFHQAFYRSARRGHPSDGVRETASSEASDPAGFLPMMSLRAPPFADEHSRRARANRRPRANPEDREAARQRILAEASAAAAADDAAESARGASQGTRGSRRRRQEQRLDSDRPTRRQRTSTSQDGDEGDGADFGYRSMFRLPLWRPPSPSSVERAGAGTTQAGVAEREGAGSSADSDRLRFFHAGPFAPFAIHSFLRGGEETPLGLPPGLPFAFVFEIAQEVMRSASNQQPLRRGAKQEVVDALPTIAGCPDDACLICQDKFAAEERPTSMPCAHAFHLDCLKPWLSEHNTCPTCRYELDTDDEQYNRKLAAQRQERAQQREKRGREESQEGSSGTDPRPLLTEDGVGERHIAAPADNPATAPAAAPIRNRDDGSDSTSVGSSAHRRAFAAAAIADLQRSTADLRRAHEQLREQLRASQRRQRHREQRASRRTARDSDGPAPLPQLEPRSREQHASRNSLPVSPIVEAPTADAS